jgi:hypothetical protein
MQNPSTHIDSNISSLLTDLDKDLLNFLYRQWNGSDGKEVPIAQVMQAFTEIDEDDFGDRCTALALDDLISSRGGKVLVLSQKGLALAQTMWDKATGQLLPVIEEPLPSPVQPGDDLIWDLSHVRNPRLSYRFAEYFSSTIGFYSSSGCVFHTRYRMRPAKDRERALVVIPDLQDEHDSYYGVPPEAAIPTRAFICPDADGGLQLRIRGPNKGKWHILPLREGLDLVQRKLGESPFLPVIMNGDLREIEPGIPALHLHRLLPGKISAHSDMELRALRRSIQHKLAERFGFKPLTGRLFA